MEDNMSATTRRELRRISDSHGPASAPVADILLAGEVSGVFIQGVIGGRTSAERAECLCALLHQFGVGNIVTGRLN